MHFFRRLGLAFSASFFSLLIFLFATFVSIHFVFDSPGNIKDTLKQSGIYDVALKSVAAQNQDKGEQGTVPLNDPGVQTALQDALPPAELQKNVEAVIDGTYSWIHGKTDKPTFAVDLNGVKDRLASNLTTYIGQKLDTLPECPADTAQPQDVEAMFAQNCRPRGVPVPAIVGQVRQQVLGDNLIKDSAINADTIKNDQGKPVFDTYKQVPTYHHYYMVSMLVMPLLIVLTAFAVVFASSTRRTGLRRLSVILLTTGIYSTAIALLGVWGLNRAVQSLDKQTNGSEVLQDKLVTIVTTLAHDMRTWWIGFGIAYVLLGIIGLLIVKYLKSRRLHDVISNEQELGHNPNIPQAGTRFDPHQTPTESKPPEPTRPPKPPKKLQF